MEQSIRIAIVDNETLFTNLLASAAGLEVVGCAGSGDLLAGYISGLLAQAHLLTDLAKTLRYAVWQHGTAADALQARRAN